MTQTEKYIWLIDTIYKAKKISLEEISTQWRNYVGLNIDEKLHRATFNRWKDDIFMQFGIVISCQRVGGYKYYIENPEIIEDNKLNKWILDTISTGNLINKNISISDRILVNKIPSGSDHLKTILDAMNDNRTVEITYKPFKHSHGYTFIIEPYCVKLFDDRWYVLGRNNRKEMRLYGLDRIEDATIKGETFELPQGFNASEFFAPYYGIIIGHDIKPQKIVLRANENHKYYMQSLPIHESQRLLKDCEEYADFEIEVAPTYDFIMKLLQFGSMIEVLSPLSLRKMMKDNICEMYEIYKNG